MKKGISKENLTKLLLLLFRIQNYKKVGGELKGDASLSLSPLPPHHTG